MRHDQPPANRPARASRTPRAPLDAARLEDLALAYAARFATTTARLEAYLRRKLRERGWQGDAAPDPAGLAARFAERGYVDDAAYARMKQSSLLRRGYGPRRIGQALAAAGVAEDQRPPAARDGADARQAALIMARKRRFGPFGASLPDRPLRERQIAAMLRAGHGLDNARELVEAPSPEAAETWAAPEDEAR